MASAEPELELPHGTYVRVPANDVSAGVPGLPGGKGGQGPHILFLNRCAGGTTITGGWPDDNTVNRSGILGGSVSFPPYPYGDASWNEVMEHARQIFSPFNIVITDQDPSPMPHDEAIVCGSGAMAGFSGAGGVAPFTCGVIDAPITFTFPDSLGDYPRSIAEVIAQEAAHAWGLEHEYKCEDPMSYLYGCGDKTFQDGDYQCGEYNPRACECGGASQNSYQYILGLFGSAVPDTQAPTALIVAPHDGEVFAPGDDFDIVVEVADDNAVKRVSLYLDGAVSSEDMSEPFGPWPVFDAPAGDYEFHLVVTDSAGKTAMSNVVRVDVTADPIGPEDGEAEDGGTGDDTAAGSGDDSGDAGIGEDDVGPEHDNGSGALPPGFGLERGDEGCACASDPRRAGSRWLVPFAALGLVGPLGRRRSSGRSRSGADCC